MNNYLRINIGPHEDFKPKGGFCEKIVLDDESDQASIRKRKIKFGDDMDTLDDSWLSNSKEKNGMIYKPFNSFNGAYVDTKRTNSFAIIDK